MIIPAFFSTVPPVFLAQNRPFPLQKIAPDYIAHARAYRVQLSSEVMNKNANIYCQNCETYPDFSSCKKNEAGDLICNVCSCELSIDASCCDCDKTLEEYEWCEDEKDDIYCEKCYAHKTAIDWINSTEADVRNLCESYGWEMPRFGSGGFNTKSKYYELTKKCALCNSGADDTSDCDCQEIKLRISDHGSAYCSEDISLAMNPSGDDHTIEILKSLLEK